MVLCFILDFFPETMSFKGEVCILSLGLKLHSFDCASSSLGHHQNNVVLRLIWKKIRHISMMMCHLTTETNCGGEGGGIGGELLT